MPKVIVAGSRDITDVQFVHDQLDNYFHDRLQDIEIVTGMARGPDRIAYGYANKHDLPKYEFYPDWNRHGNRAGFLRNVQMADFADELIAFWDGRSKGTRHMIQQAERSGLKVEIVYVRS